MTIEIYIVDQHGLPTNPEGDPDGSAKNPDLINAQIADDIRRIHLNEGGCLDGPWRVQSREWWEDINDGKIDSRLLLYIYKP